MQTTPHSGADGVSASKDRLHDLRASVAAIAALRRTLDVGSEAQLCEVLAGLLLGATSSLHTVVLVRAGAGFEVAAYQSRAPIPLDPATLQGGADACLQGMSADAPDCVELAGLPFVIVPLSADGRRVLGALCLALPGESPVDVAALTALAASGAAQLLRLRAVVSPVPDVQRRDESGILRTIIDNMPDHIYAKDANGRFIIGNNAAAVGIFGVPDAQALVGKSDLDFYPIECGQRFFTDEQQIIRTGEPIVDQIEANVNKDGVQRFFSTTKYPFHGEQGEVLGIVGISRDVTLRVSADEALKLRNRAVESSQDGIVITSCAAPGQAIVYTNPAFERITGFALLEAQVHGIERFLLEQGDRGAAPLRRAALIDHHGERRVLPATRKDGSAYWCEVRLAVIRAPDGAATHKVYTLSDVTAAHQAEQQLSLLASHDPLTGLPNRRMLMERLAQAVAVGERGGVELAVAFIDLDGLKRLNDEHGHDAGDVLLRTVAERVKGCIRQSDTVARLGGDEFVLVTLHRSGAGEAEMGGVGEVLAKVQEQVALPIALGALAVRVTCSIGVSMFGRDAATPDALLKRADQAMYLAKKSGRNRIVYSS